MESPFHPLCCLSQLKVRIVQKNEIYKTRGHVDQGTMSCVSVAIRLLHHMLVCGMVCAFRILNDELKNKKNLMRLNYYYYIVTFKLCCGKHLD